jgi:hypothetical protein
MKPKANPIPKEKNLEGGGVERCVREHVVYTGTRIGIYRDWNWYVQGLIVVYI